LGAVQDGDVLKISISAKRDWKGKIVFDSPRHQTIMKMPLDWPRINQFPEWFTAQSDKSYAVNDLTYNSKKIYTGRDLQQGLKIHLGRSTQRCLLVQTSESSVEP